MNESFRITTPGRSQRGNHWRSGSDDFRNDRRRFCVPERISSDGREPQSSMASHYWRYRWTWYGFVDRKNWNNDCVIFRAGRQGYEFRKNREPRKRSPPGQTIGKRSDFRTVRDTSVPGAELLRPENLRVEHERSEKKVPERNPGKIRMKCSVSSSRGGRRIIIHGGGGSSGVGGAYHLCSPSFRSFLHEQNLSGLYGTDGMSRLL